MITIIKPGLLTTIQDLGRNGFQKFGVISSGAMDPFSHRIANILVGNPENQATIEITINGPTILFSKEALISICGGDLSPTVDGIPIPLWRPIFIKKGGQLDFGPCQKGCRAYLAAAGGFAVPDIMNSKSTYLRAGIGGFQGRQLKKGDRIPYLSLGLLSYKMFQSLKKQTGQSSFFSPDWSVSPYFIPAFKKDYSVRVMEGREWDLFSKESKHHFFSNRYEITHQSDRMGYRLKGIPLYLTKKLEMISEAVNFGTIQVSGDGNPIILLADRQTTGGYPKIGQIATVDLPLVAQAKPGDCLRFKKIFHSDAQLLFLKREQGIRLLKQGIRQKFR
jgi:antagonist of KipI